MRLPVMPDVPTMNGATGVTDFEAVSWHVLFAHKNTPKPVVDKLYEEMKVIMADPEVVKKISELGLLPHAVGSIDEARAYIKSELAKWGGIIKDLGLAGTL